MFSAAYSGSLIGYTVCQSAFVSPVFVGGYICLHIDKLVPLKVHQIIY